MGIPVGIFCSVIFSYMFLPREEGKEPKISPTIYPSCSIFLVSSNNRLIAVHVYALKLRRLLICSRS